MSQPRTLFQKLWDSHIVRQAEGGDVPAACFDAEAPRCAIAPVCILRGVLSDAVDAFYGVLDRRTLADLVRNRKSLRTILMQPNAGSA